MNNTGNNNVVTRFAPSPTGFMHVGSIRTAIFAYLLARKNNGKFILRIEDTDKNREVSGSVEHIIKSLEWFKIDYDYGPNKNNHFGSAFQSERLDIYIDYAKKLVDKGLAYPDPYTEEEIESFRKKSEQDKKPFLFRDFRPSQFDKWEGKKPLRFKVPEIKRYNWFDIVMGDLSAGEEALDDFILIKADGYPTYNFAHIIDDFEMGVNYVIRGQEFISSTPKFLSLYDALEFKYPNFVTVPPILKDDRSKKLSKRDGSKDIFKYKDEGYLPEALFNFLALLGWHPSDERELFTKEELINIFDITKIQKGGAGFDDKKLNWINKEHIRRLKNSERLVFINKFLTDDIKNLPYFNDEMLLKASHTIIDHIETGLDITSMSKEGHFSYFFDIPDYESLLLLWKNENSIDTKRRLTEVLDIIKNIDENIFNDVSSIKDTLLPYAEKEGKGQVLWPLRVALSGLEKSSDPFSIMHIVGKDRVVLCINKAIEMLK